MKKISIKANVIRLIAVILSMFIMSVQVPVYASNGSLPAPTSKPVPTPNPYIKVYSKDASKDDSKEDSNTYSIINNYDNIFGFENTENLQPGDSKTVIVKLENHWTEQLCFHIKAKALTGDAAKRNEKSHPLHTADPYYPEREFKTAEDLLLDVIDISVTDDIGSKYKGKLRGYDDAPMYSSEGVQLSIIKPGADNSKTVEVTISVPGGDKGLFNELPDDAKETFLENLRKDVPGARLEDLLNNPDNFFMDTLCTFKWEFTTHTPIKVRYMSEDINRGTVNGAINNVFEVYGCAGSDLTVPLTTPRAGYQFRGWNPVVPDLFPTEDAVYTAMWVYIGRGGNGPDGSGPWRGGYGNGGDQVGTGGVPGDSNNIVVGNNEIPDFQSPTDTLDGDGTLDFHDDIPIGTLDEPDIVVVVEPGDKMPQTGGMRTFVIQAAIVLAFLLGLLAFTYKKENKQKK